MRRVAFSCIVCLLTLGLAACGATDAPTRTTASSAIATDTATKLDAFKGMKGKLVVGGATTLDPLARNVCDRITQRYPDVTFEVKGGGSAVGIRDTGTGAFDVGLATRALEPGEESAYPGMRAFPFAHEGLGVIVNRSNPVETLTTSQLAGIFSGRITDWSAVGGKPGPIHVYMRDEAQAGRKQLQTYLKVAAFGPAKAIPAETQEMHNLVAGDPCGIGYIGFSVGSDSVKFLILEGVTPVEENVANGTWVMIRTDRLLTKGEPTGLAKAYVEYFLSPECADLVKHSGFLPLAR